MRNERDPIHEVLKKEEAEIIAQRVAKALTKLSERDQVIVRLAVLEQKPIHLVATTLDLTISNAQKATKRAKDRLAEKLLADPTFRAIAA